MCQGMTIELANLLMLLGTSTLCACIRRWSVEGSSRDAPFTSGLGLYDSKSKKM